MARSGIRLGRSTYDEHQIAAWPLSGRCTYKRPVRVFERDGFTYHRTKGDHLIYVKPRNRRPIVIPIYHSAPVFIIKNLLRTSGMTREQYLELLKDS